MTTLIFGATTGLGHALAEQLAAEGRDLALLGRDAADLNRLAADLRARNGVEVMTLIADATSPAEVADRIADLVRETTIDVALFPVGVSIESDVIGAPVQDQIELVSANLLGVMAATSVLAGAMRAAGTGRIVAFSSIAASRGRPRNAAYAAAKRGLESWCESLRADLVGGGVEVSWYIIGYMETNLSYGQRLPLPVATPKSVARRVIADLDRPGGRRFAPRWWQPITVVVRLLPFALFRKVKA